VTSEMMRLCAPDCARSRPAEADGAPAWRNDGSARHVARRGHGHVEVNENLCARVSVLWLNFRRRRGRRTSGLTGSESSEASVATMMRVMPSAKACRRSDSPAAVRAARAGLTLRAASRSAASIRPVRDRHVTRSQC
jgi:hypothetical protein